MFNSTNFQYQDPPLNDFQFQQVYSNLEHLQRQINSINNHLNHISNYHPNPNYYSNSTFFRNRIPSYYNYPYMSRYSRRPRPVPPPPTPTPPQNSSPSQNTPSNNTETNAQSNFRNVLDNIFNLNDINNLASMEISVRNAPPPSMFREFLNNFSNREQRESLSSFKDIESNTEISVLNIENEHQDICVICREMFQNNDLIRTIKKCNHYFHLSCSNTWFNNNIKCPLCRQCIKPNENENENNESSVGDTDTSNTNTPSNEQTESNVNSE